MESQREGGSDQKFLPLKFRAVVDKMWKWNQYSIQQYITIQVIIKCLKICCYSLVFTVSGNEHLECSVHSPPCSGESFVDGAFDNVCGRME
ncbi:hypothetical protein T03_14366 [Trichinella britovi]|uniref:Uncharacterized protein n=1 Tax=Trichinella britovi TaxID=45882 RepID=A0A0V1C7J6_TRIBR|nr:hypothetical protein T03_14366 [Trichinella britovi]